MQVRKGVSAIVIGITILLSSSGNAGILDDVWRRFVDPFQIGEGSKNALQAVRKAQDAITALSSLQKVVDEDVRSYLQDLDRKIDKIEGATLNVIDHTVVEIYRLEKTILTDVFSILRKTECVTVRVIDDVLKESLRDVLPTWLEGGKRVVQLPFGKTFEFLWWGGDPLTVEIDLLSGPQPDDVFYEIESAVLENLDLATDDSLARKIYGTYGNLARLALKTQCLYEGQEYGEKFIRLYAKYNALVHPWNRSVQFGD